MATTKRGVVSTRLEDLSGRICYFSMFTLEVWTDLFAVGTSRRAAGGDARFRPSESDVR